MSRNEWLKNIRKYSNVWKHEFKVYVLAFLCIYNKNVQSNFLPMKQSSLPPYTSTSHKTILPDVLLILMEDVRIDAVMFLFDIPSSITVCVKLRNASIVPVEWSVEKHIANKIVLQVKVTHGPEVSNRHG